MSKLISMTAAMTCLAITASAGNDTPHWSLTWKKMQTTGPELELIGTLPTRTTHELGASDWSVGCETLDRNYADFDSYKPYLSELGVTSARIQSGWARCEKQKGRYDFAWIDHIVDGMLEEGVQPWINLGYGNPLYGAEKGLGSKIFTDEPTMKAWLKFVETIVARYRDKVHEWEIWNEPNLGENRTNYDAYASLLSHTVETIRRVQPDAVIIGMGLSRMPLGYTEHVLDLLRERGQLGMIDYVSFHPYHENPDDATPGIEALARLVKSYDPDIRLFQGESGCPATLEWAHALRYYEWNEYSQAKWVARRMANDWMMGIRSSIFTFVDLQYPNMQQSFGLLRTNLFKEVVYKRPSFHTVQHMVNLFRPELRSAGHLNHESNTPRRLTVAGIERQKDGTLVGAVVWQNDRIPSDNLAFEPIELWIEGLSLKDPVLIEMITGLRSAEISRAFRRRTHEIHGTSRMGFSRSDSRTERPARRDANTRTPDFRIDPGHAFLTTISRTETKAFQVYDRIRQSP